MTGPKISRESRSRAPLDEKVAALLVNHTSGAPALLFTSQLASFGMAKLDPDYSLSAVSIF